ncbi:MAG: ATP-NAD kinase [Alphaproteobacteria bacterium]|nr:ATP-NAD kinase [Alphaproteobacteria bacterium]
MRVGILVNPLAGLGGRVGLKGTDTAEIAARSLALGAIPMAGARMALALRALPREVTVLAPAGAMGEAAARAAGFSPRVVGEPAGVTTADDTVRLARAMVRQGIDLLLFAGGDGTARDVLVAIEREVPVLGVPAGVKMHSAVFGATPRAAGDLAGRFLHGRAATVAVEVMDIDEAAYRVGSVSARLYGYLLAPYAEDVVQGVKIGGGRSDCLALASIAEAIAQAVEPDRLLLLGPGTTVRAVAERLGVVKTLLGVDLVRHGAMVAADANEQAILRALSDGASATVVVSPIGGQGFILGRGNQQMSPDVIRRVGLGNIVVTATEAKLAALHNQTLRVDTGEADLDHALAGYRRVITGVGIVAVCRVA